MQSARCAERGKLSETTLAYPGGMRDLQDSVHGPWWHLSPSRLLRRVLVIAAAMALIMIGATNWLQREWQTAPTIRDGQVVDPWRQA